jgi:hypothetical protein
MGKIKSSQHRKEITCVSSFLLFLLPVIIISASIASKIMAKKHAKPTSEPRPTSDNKNKKKDSDTEDTNAERVDQRHTTGAPIFFFEDDEEPYGFFCQWYRCRFTDPTSGLEFSSAEQWMMWNKAQLVGDEASAKTIMSTTSPRKQKAARSGRRRV